MVFAEWLNAPQRNLVGIGRNMPARGEVQGILSGPMDWILHYIQNKHAFYGAIQVLRNAMTDGGFGLGYFSVT